MNGANNTAADQAACDIPAALADIAARARRWDTAAAEMLDSKWSKQVGARAKRLAEMMRTGRVG